MKPTNSAELPQRPEAKALVARLQKWCGLRDRSVREANDKLDAWLGASDAWAGSPEATDGWRRAVMDGLVAQGFLDDERCAASYARVHHEHKSWGPLKIRAGLRARGVSPSAIDAALAAIDDEAWQASCTALARRRQREALTHRDRTLRWLASRGFPSYMAFEACDAVSLDAEGT